jgi:hypothetical protein
MPRAINFIGAFQVRHWFGQMPGRLAETMEVLQSPAADFQAVRLLGQRSDIYERESIVDVPSIPHGRLLFAQYQTLLTAGATQLIWNSVDLDAEGIRAKVLSVEIVELIQRVYICGGLFPPNNVDLRVRWRFLLVPYDT